VDPGPNERRQESLIGAQALRLVDIFDVGGHFAHLVVDGGVVAAHHLFGADQMDQAREVFETLRAVVGPQAPGP
jgi:hypothetical protein